MASIDFSRACPSTRRGRALAVCGLGAVVAFGLALGRTATGFLAGSHFSPCNPRNLDRCARRLSSTLLGLDRLDSGEDSGDRASEEAAALCPSLAETVDCYYWFSQRCLPQREQLFYSKLYVDASVAVQGVCRSDSGPPLLVRHGPCLRAARTQRSKCNERFERLRHGDVADDVPDDVADVVTTAPTLGADSLIDSLYDVTADGAFQVTLCRALREYIMCGLQLVSDNCGISVALHIQDLHDNLTSLVFKNKCDPALRPVLPGPVVPLHSVDLMTTTSGTFTMALISIMVLMLPVCIVLIKRLVWVKK